MLYTRKQLEKFEDVQNEFFSKIQAKVDDISTFQNELKEEQDRQGERGQRYQSDMLSFTKGLATAIKKLRQDQSKQEEDFG